MKVANQKNLRTPALYNTTKRAIKYLQGIAGLDWWIAQSGLQSNSMDWIVIDNPKSKLDFGFGLSTQFFHFNPNPDYCSIP